MNGYAARPTRVTSPPSESRPADPLSAKRAQASVPSETQGRDANRSNRKRGYVLRRSVVLHFAERPGLEELPAG
jgi:hypothetical protein